MPLRRSLWILALSPCLALGQDRLPNMPGYDRYQMMSSAAYSAVKGGTVRVKWQPDGKSFVYAKGGQYLKFDLATREETPADQTPLDYIADRTYRSGYERGRQLSVVHSPNGRLDAISRGGNLFISDNGQETQITRDGGVASRIKYGTASWVYGEELSQIDSMWWSPDSSKLAYYRFDETRVKDYYLAMNQLKFQDTVNVEAYPKPGQPNPVATLYILDLATKKSVKVDTGFNTGVPDIDEYVWDVSWTPTGDKLTFFRMNRLQNRQELDVADPATGACRKVFGRARDDGWLEESTAGEFPTTQPDLWWIMDSDHPTKFFYISDDSGYRNLDLYDIDKGFLAHVTHHDFDVRTIKCIDTSRGEVWYAAQGDNNPYLVQLWRVQFDGANDRRLTDAAFSHKCSVSPKGSGFVDVEQTLTDPPVSQVCDRTGAVLATLTKADVSKFNGLGLKKNERFICKAADGVTDIYGILQKPSNFDPSKKYPLLISVYGGPDAGNDDETFEVPDPITELGFCVAWIDGRGSTARGVAFKCALYHAMGLVEIDDQAAGARYLAKRPYIDADHIGIYGTSYGGYASLMAILRYPDVFKAASIGSPATDWRNYDSIYTERYMGLPDAQQTAYDKGSALPLAKNLKGHVLLYFGTSDNNVHPSHTYMLVRELDRAGKSYEMAIGPDQGHSGVNEARMMEFFIDHLGQAH